MPLKILTAEKALKNLKSRTAIWPSRGKNNRKGCLPLPAVSPSFRIGDDDKIFCLGSCFAAHIGDVLKGHGFDVVTGVPNPHQEGAWGGSNHLIRYNVFSILNEFRWALNPGSYDFNSLFVEEAEGLWMDPYGHTQNHPHTKEHLCVLRKFTNGVTSRLAECRVLLLTLGLTEVWFDQKTQLYMNFQPSSFAINQEPDRFSFHILSFEDVAGALEEIYALVGRYCIPDAQIIITTSPVPLHATYSGQDIFVANMHSKSTQRAAVGEFVERHANVDYFPSYETITLGNPDVAWKDDLRHVDDHAVKLIMENVVRNYAPEKKSSIATIEQFQKLDEQLNGLRGRYFWDRLTELSSQVDTLKAELARVTENKEEAKRSFAVI